jgi:cytochrome c peroxidase
MLSAAAASLFVLAAVQDREDLPAFLGPLPKVVDPRDNPSTPAKVELGRRLYFDPRLSGNGAISCATCHNPALGFADGLGKGVGFNGAILGRGSPSVLNAAYYETQFWDGRAPSLEEQAKGPIQADLEMNNTAEKAVATVRSIPGYVKRFQEAFGGEPTFDRIAQAIAAFERIVVDQDSPFDRWARGNAKAMDVAQVRGFDLFVGKAGCAVCHSGPNFADKRFHNVGVRSGDPGRAGVTKDPADQGAFKTPTVRNAALTGPYMHDGSVKTLRALIDHYEKASNEREKNPNLSILLRPFRLTDAEKGDLEAFMHALTGDKRDPRIFEVPELPQ